VLECEEERTRRGVQAERIKENADRKGQNQGPNEKQIPKIADIKS
jgi:hypothetical protein